MFYKKLRITRTRKTRFFKALDYSVMFILFNNFSHRRRECVGSCLFKRVEQYSNINFGFVYTETEGSFASKKNLI